jgi:hypothetical protein
MKTKTCHHVTLTPQAQIKSMQDKNHIDQLKAIVAEKEKKIKILEDEVEVLRVREQSNQKIQYILSNNSSNQSEQSPPKANDLTYVENQESRHNTGRNERNPAKANSKNDREILQSRQNSARGIKLIARPSSSANNKYDRKDFDELKIDYHELNTLSKSLEVERDRLIELVRLLQTRFEEANQKLVESDNKYNEQRRRCVNLEKQLEKSKLDGNNPKQSLCFDLFLWVGFHLKPLIFS